MAHHERDSIPSNDLSARNEFAVPQDGTFLNSANCGGCFTVCRRAREGAPAARVLLSYLTIALQLSVRLVAAI